MLETETDRENERAVAQVLEAQWDCKVNSFGDFSPVDWWITRQGRMAALAELKCRPVSSAMYANAYLSVRKWLDLYRFVLAFHLPALFVNRFTDGIRYIDVRSVRGALAIVTNGRCVSRNDREPVIEVPIASMFAVDYPPWAISDDDGRPWHLGVSP